MCYFFYYTTTFLGSRLLKSGMSYDCALARAIINFGRDARIARCNVRSR